MDLRIMALATLITITGILIMDTEAYMTTMVFIHIPIIISIRIGVVMVTECIPLIFMVVTPAAIMEDILLTGITRTRLLTEGATGPAPCHRGTIQEQAHPVQPEALHILEQQEPLFRAGQPLLQQQLIPQLRTREGITVQPAVHLPEPGPRILQRERLRFAPTLHRGLQRQSLNITAQTVRILRATIIQECRHVRPITIRGLLKLRI